MQTMTRLGTVLAVAAFAVACGKKVEEKKDPGPGTGAGTGTAAEPKPAAAAPGVDMAKKVVRIGALNDESGPAKTIGLPFANGKRLLVKAIETGAIKVLPEGWKIELVEKDHGYNPQQSVQLYKEIKDNVLFLTTSFGTPPTMPLLEDLKRDDMIAFPASLSSAMAANENTPPLGPSYSVEAMRAMDYAVETAGGADKVKAAIVYQRDDYGEDGLAGWKKAAEFHKVKLVSEQTIKPTDQDFTAVVKALKDAGATHVLLTTLPSATPGILGTAAKMKYGPQWIGNTPAWVDVFFKKLPEPLLKNFLWVTGLAYWGEELPGMKEFLEVWEKHGQGMGTPDFYVLASYVHGLVQMEALKRAIESNDVTRAGFKKALRSIKGWNAGGLTQPVDLTATPYVTSTRTRILQPKVSTNAPQSDQCDFRNPEYAKGTCTRWMMVKDYAEPKTK